MPCVPVETGGRDCGQRGGGADDTPRQSIASHASLVSALDAVVSESAKKHTTTASDIDAVSMIPFALMWVRSAGELAEEAHDVIRSCRFGRVDAPAMERALTETESN